MWWLFWNKALPAAGYPRGSVAGMIVVIKVAVAVFVTAPVYNSALYRSHQEVYRQQQEPDPAGCKSYVKSNVSQPKHHAE